MKTYLFDFDGTLVDSMPAFGKSMLQILDDYHIPYGEDLIKTITPLGLNGTAEYYVGLGVPLSKEDIMRLMGKHLMDAYLYHIPAKEHVVEVLGKLKAAGASLNILTASPHITVDPCLARLGMTDLFDYVWSCDDFATTKADPDIYVQAARRLGVPVEEVLFLDDNLNANKTAKAAGMRVCGVYDLSSAEYEAEMRAAADGYITDFRELLTGER